MVADRHLSVSPVHLTSVSKHKSAHKVTIINSTSVPFLYAKEPNELVLEYSKEFAKFTNSIKEQLVAGTICCQLVINALCSVTFIQQNDSFKQIFF